MALELKKIHCESRLRYTSRTAWDTYRIEEQSLFAFVLLSTTFSSVVRSLTWMYMTYTCLKNPYIFSFLIQELKLVKELPSKTQTNHCLLKKENDLHDIKAL